MGSETIWDQLSGLCATRCAMAEPFGGVVWLITEEGIMAFMCGYETTVERERDEVMFWRL